MFKSGNLLQILYVLLLVIGNQSDTTVPPTPPPELPTDLVPTKSFDLEDDEVLAELLELPETLDAERTLPANARHFLCVPLLRIFNLELREPLRQGEYVGVTGSHKRLGEWQLERSVNMRSLNDNGLEWLAKVPICADSRIAYRYFIYTLDGRRRKRVRVWEGHAYPRVLESYEIYQPPGVDYFGEAMKPSIDLGGREGTWLRYDKLIELKFVWQRHFRWHQKKAPRQGKVKLKLIVYGKNSNSNSDAIIEVSRYSYNNSEFRQQPAHGVVYNFEGPNNSPPDIVVFRIFEPLRYRNAYKLLIYNLEHIEVANVILVSLDLKSSDGVVQLPIFSSLSGFEIGQITLPYLIVRPLPQAQLLDMRGSYQHYWPLNWPTMHVGNRGAGKSFYESNAPHVENTIPSYLFVKEIFGEMVKLEVQLTRDYVPLVWHEYGFYTAPRGRKVERFEDLDYVLIQELSYSELRWKRVFMPKDDGDIEEYTHWNVPRVKDRIFSRLAEIFRELPKTLGLLIEIKWPQPFDASRSEGEFSFGADGANADVKMTSLLDKNNFVNAILAVTARYGCGRPLIFASFDADICSMLRYKQNVYPALFMTAGRSRKWRLFKDLRTRSFSNAVNFAQSEFLMGTAPYVMNFIKRPIRVNRALDLYQALFLWGDELQNGEALRKFEELLVTGLIYDRMDLHRPVDKYFAFFEEKILLDLFEKQCSAPLRNASQGLNIKREVFKVKTKRKQITITLRAQ